MRFCRGWEILCSCKLKHFVLNDIFGVLTALFMLHWRKASLPSSLKQCWVIWRNHNKDNDVCRVGRGVHIIFLKNHTPFDNNSVADRNCFHLWCRPHLAANCDLFKIRTFPWSPSKAELGTFYPFTRKVGSKYTYIILEALVWSQQSSVQFNFRLWVTITWVTLAKSHQLKGLCHAICCLLKN